MKKAIYTRVNDFNVKYEFNEYGHVSVYVDGDLVESHQHTWFMRVLLDEALLIKDNGNAWRKNYEKLESIAKDYIDEDFLNELLED